MDLKIFDQKIKKNQTFNFKGTLKNNPGGGGLMDSEIMYKNMVKEQQKKKNIVSKKKDFVKEEKNFEEAHSWKNSMSKIMNESN